jgi:DNA-binding MarR family transcriptional regulator
VSRGQEDSTWTFLTNHAQVLLGISGNPNARLRDLAELVGITERAAQRIVVDLVDAGYVERRRVGRRNHYTVNPKVEMRHAAQEGHPVGQLLALLELRDQQQPAT